MIINIHGILQARILERVAISFSRGSSQPKGWTQVCPALQADSSLSEPPGRTIESASNTKEVLMVLITIRYGCPRVVLWLYHYPWSATVLPIQYVFLGERKPVFSWEKFWNMLSCKLGLISSILIMQATHFVLSVVRDTHIFAIDTFVIKSLPEHCAVLLFSLG